MLVEFFTKFLQSTAGLLVFAIVLVFAEMFVAKKWFIHFTPIIKSAKVRRSVNLLLGVATCFALSAIEIFAICDFVGSSFSWLIVVVTTFAATELYLMIEKIFGESGVNELGKSLLEIISKSDKFVGDISKSNVTKIAKELIEKAHGVDAKQAMELTDKETAVVDDVIARITSIVEDGVVTDEERAVVDELAKNNDLTQYDVFRKYKDIIGK